MNGNALQISVPESALRSDRRSPCHSSIGRSRHFVSSNESRDRLCAEPALITSAVEGLPRFDSSVITWRRRTVEDVEIASEAIPAGSDQLLVLCSGNCQRRPPNVTPVATTPTAAQPPDRLRVHRHPLAPA